MEKNKILSPRITWRYKRWFREMWRHVGFFEMLDRWPLHQKDFQDVVECPDCRKPLVGCKCCGGE